MPPSDLAHQLDQAIQKANLAAVQAIVGQGLPAAYPRLFQAGLDRVLNPRIVGDEPASLQPEARQMAGLLLGAGARVEGSHLRQATIHDEAELLGDLLREVARTKGAVHVARMVMEQAEYRHRGMGLDTAPSAVVLAAERGNPETLGLLLDTLHRANRVLAEPGVLHSLVKHDENTSSAGARLACLDLLMAHGADPDTLDKAGNSPLHLTRSVAMTKALLAAGANPRTLNAQKNRPLFTLWLRRSRENIGEQEALDIASRLLDAGARWTDGPTLDMLNLQMGDHALTEWLARGRVRNALQAHVAPATGQDTSGRKPRAF